MGVNYGIPPRRVLSCLSGVLTQHLEGGTLHCRKIYILQKLVTHKNILLLTITHSGDSTGLSAEGITGRVLLIVTEVIAVLALAFLIATCACLFRNYEGNHLSVHLTVYDLVFAVCMVVPANLYCSVILCSYLHKFSHNYNEVKQTILVLTQTITKIISGFQE